MGKRVFVVLLAAMAVFVPDRLLAQQTSSPASAGLSVEQALSLRSVSNPRLGDDFVAFTLVAEADR